MITLGIHDGHNASACLFGAGTVLAAHQEERLSRKKNQGGFPAAAIESVLRIAGIGLDQVDRVAYAGRMLSRMPTSCEAQRLGYKHNSRPSAAMRDALKSTLIDRARQAVTNSRRLNLLRRSGFAGPVEFVDHHTCHASAAYYGWGRLQDEVLVLTLDGAGDRICATVNVGRDGRLTRIAAVDETASIGIIWAVVTAMTGMVALEHEYKLMGLAPYAGRDASERVARRLSSWFRFDGDGLAWRLAGDSPAANRSYEHLRRMLEFERLDAIAGGLQLFTEKFIGSWVRNCIRATGIRNVALGGGVFMNVKLNQIVMELAEVERLFVFPSCGDETNPIGACYHLAAAGETVRPLEDLYWGPEFSPEQIRASVNAYRFSSSVAVRESHRIEDEAAELLARGEIVARFSGREEFGARSLGNRALLAPPHSPQTAQLLNEMIKQRDFWMPFALSIADDRAGEYLRNPKRLAAPYMIMCFDTSAAGAGLAAGIHPRDRTVRPQIVDEYSNPSFYRLIKVYERLTGTGAIVNTSLNLHGEPLVSAPADALRLFEISGLRHLALGDLLLSKQEPHAHAAINIH
jgi:carbamoyltransferase